MYIYIFYLYKCIVVNDTLFAFLRLPFVLRTISPTISDVLSSAWKLPKTVHAPTRSYATCWAPQGRSLGAHFISCI